MKAKRSRLSLCLRLSMVLVLETVITITPRAAYPQTLLQDFYNQSGPYQGNVTPPGVYQGANLNVITGGGFVFKSPRKGFQPWSITPPSLRMGCGGIDFFMGGFSVPSRAEFITFLRNIGTSLPGLAFQLALQSLSPDLEKQVSEFRQMLMRLSADNISSCEAAKWLLDQSGSTEAIQQWGQSAREKGENDGTWSDDSAARDETRRDGGAIRGKCDSTQVNDDNGEVQERCEINLTWALLGGGRWTNTDATQIRQLLMTLLGPRVYTWVGGGADSALKENSYEAYVIPIDHFSGSLDATDLTGLQWYVCDEPVNCLNPTLEPFTDKSLANQMWNAVQKYRDSIQARNASLVTDTDLFLLSTTTSIPLLRLTSVLSTGRYQNLANDVLRVYAEGAAFELAMSFLNDVAESGRKAASSKQFAGASSRMRAHAEAMLKRIQDLQGEIRANSGFIQDRMARAANFIQVIQHFEDAMRANLATNLAANLRFAQTAKP